MVDEEVPKHLRFQKYIGDWAVDGKQPQGIPSPNKQIKLAPQTYHEMTVNKTLEHELYEKIKPAGELLK